MNPNVAMEDGSAEHAPQGPELSQAKLVRDNEDGDPHRFQSSEPRRIVECCPGILCHSNECIRERNWSGALPIIVGSRGNRSWNQSEEKGCPAIRIVSSLVTRMEKSYIERRLYQAWGLMKLRHVVGLAGLVLLLSGVALSQELNCEVTVNTDNITSGQKDYLRSFEGDVKKVHQQQSLYGRGSWRGEN